MTFLDIFPLIINSVHLHPVVSLYILMFISYIPIMLMVLFEYFHDLKFLMGSILISIAFFVNIVYFADSSTWKDLNLNHYQKNLLTSDWKPIILFISFFSGSVGGSLTAAGIRTGKDIQAIKTIFGRFKSQFTKKKLATFSVPSTSSSDGDSDDYKVD